MWGHRTIICNHKVDDYIQVLSYKPFRHGAWWMKRTPFTVSAVIKDGGASVGQISPVWIWMVLEVLQLQSKLILLYIQLSFPEGKGSLLHLPLTLVRRGRTVFGQDSTVEPHLNPTEWRISSWASESNLTLPCSFSACSEKWHFMLPTPSLIESSMPVNVFFTPYYWILGKLWAICWLHTVKSSVFYNKHIHLLFILPGTDYQVWNYTIFMMLQCCCTTTIPVREADRR